MPSRTTTRLPIRATCALFFFMPFQHSEDLGDQDFCCTLFATLGDEDNDKYALEHRDIVARFGRFPHRNEALGRESTAGGARLPQDGEAIRAVSSSSPLRAAERRDLPTRRGGLPPTMCGWKTSHLTS